MLALWADEYRSFLQTGQAVAINGRYLLPIMPMTLIILALGMDTALRLKLRTKVIMASIAVACMLWGGGTLTYILRSNDAWYWPSTPLKDANHVIQKTLGPITPGYYHPGEFMGKN